MAKVGNNAHYKRREAKVGAYQDQSSLGSWAGIYAGQLNEWAKVLGVDPTDVTDALDELDLEGFTQIENEDPELHHLSLVREDAKALAQHVGADTDTVAAQAA